MLVCLHSLSVTRGNVQWGKIWGWFFFRRVLTPGAATAWFVWVFRTCIHVVCFSCFLFSEPKKYHTDLERSNKSFSKKPITQVKNEGEDYGYYQYQFNCHEISINWKWHSLKCIHVHIDKCIWYRIQLQFFMSLMCISIRINFSRFHTVPKKCVDSFSEAISFLNEII